MPACTRPCRLDENGNEADFEVGVGHLRRIQQTCQHGPDTLALVCQGRLIEDRDAGVERRVERFLMHVIRHRNEDGVNGWAAQQLSGAGKHGHFVTEFGADALLRGGAGRGCRDDMGAPVASQRGNVSHPGPGAVAY